MRSRKLGLAGRAGRWSAAHRKTAISGWVAFVVAAVLVGGAVGTKTLEDGGDGESAAAARTLEGGFPQAAVEQVLVQSKGGGSIHSPDARAAVAAVEARLRKLPFVRGLRGPYEEGAGGQVSADGRSGLIEFSIPETGELEPDEVVGRALDQVAAVQRRHPNLRVEEVGDASGPGDGGGCCRRWRSHFSSLCGENCELIEGSG